MDSVSFVLCALWILPTHDWRGRTVGNNRGVSGNRFVLNRWATFSVNGGEPQRLRQRDTNAGIILSQPLNVTFNEGNNNFITIAGLNGSTYPSRLVTWIRILGMLISFYSIAKASDIDRIVVYGNIYEDEAWVTLHLVRYYLLYCYYQNSSKGRDLCLASLSPLWLVSNLFLLAYWDPRSWSSKHTSYDARLPSNPYG